MKRLFITMLLVGGMILYGCNKDNSSPAVTGLTGTWRYAGYSGGFAGLPFHSASDSVEAYIQIDTATNRILVNNNGRQGCSTYSFEQYPDYPASSYYTGLLTVKDSIMPFADKLYDIGLFHDTLTLYPHDCIDCFVASYVIVSKHFNWCSGSGN